MSTFQEFTYRSVQSAFRLYFEPLKWMGRLLGRNKESSERRRNAERYVLKGGETQRDTTGQLGRRETSN